MTAKPFTRSRMRLTATLVFQVRIEFIQAAQRMLHEIRAHERCGSLRPGKSRFTRLTTRLGERFGLSERSIRDIVLGKRWKAPMVMEPSRHKDPGLYNSLRRMRHNDPFELEWPTTDP
jgi:hypothetical protein